MLLYVLWILAVVSVFYLEFALLALCFNTPISWNNLIILGDEGHSSIKQEILDKIAALITAAFGLVAALAWNDAIKLLFKELFGTQEQVGPMIIYAIVVTVIAVILTIIVARAASKAKNLIVKTFSCKLCDFTSTVESEYMEHLAKTHAANQDKFLSK